MMWHGVMGNRLGEVGKEKDAAPRFLSHTNGMVITVSCMVYRTHRLVQGLIG